MFVQTKKPDYKSSSSKPTLFSTASTRFSISSSKLRICSMLERVCDIHDVSLDNSSVCAFFVSVSISTYHPYPHPKPSMREANSLSRASKRGTTLSVTEWYSSKYGFMDTLINSLPCADMILNTGKLGGFFSCGRDSDPFPPSCQKPEFVFEFSNAHITPWTVD